MRGARWGLGLLLLLLLVGQVARASGREADPGATDNPLLPLPAPPLGVQASYDDLPFRVTPAKVRLGRWLFYDRRLSADGTLACAGCHDPTLGFSDRRARAVGIRGQVGARKTPPLVNLAFSLYENYFWDGRAPSLIAQAPGPIQNPLEMGSRPEAVVTTLSGIAGYRRAFREAFGDPRLDLPRVAEALSAYEATRLSGGSPYDRFDSGEEGALDAAQKRGRELFFGAARCSQCHVGWALSDAKFHNLGVGRRAPSAEAPTGFADLGRRQVTGRDEDTGAFKTPTLRDVARRAPYMHDGSLATLRAVVLLYNRGGNQNPWLDRKLEPLHLPPDDLDALVAFLQALDGTGYQDQAPRSFPR